MVWQDLTKSDQSFSMRCWLLLFVGYKVLKVELYWVPSGLIIGLAKAEGGFFDERIPVFKAELSVPAGCSAVERRQLLVAAL